MYNIWWFQKFFVPLHLTTSHKTAGGSESEFFESNPKQNVELRTVSKS